MKGKEVEHTKRKNRRREITEERTVKASKRKEEMRRKRRRKTTSKYPFKLDKHILPIILTALSMQINSKVRAHLKLPYSNNSSRPVVHNPVCHHNLLELYQFHFLTSLEHQD